MGKTKPTTEQLSMLPEKKKNTKGKRVFNVRALLEKKFHTVFETDKAKQHKDTPYWREMLGDIEGRCKIIIYGRSGSGKSVLTLQMVQYFSQVFGKADYNSWEERANKTLKLRVQNFNIISKTLWFLNSYTIDEVCRRIEKNYTRIVVIDSVQYARFGKAEMQILDDKFAKRNIILILVSFGTSEGKTRNADDLLHASDVKMFVHKGELSVTSRYLSKPFKKQLFAPELSVELPEPEELTPNLFNPSTNES